MMRYTFQKTEDKDIWQSLSSHIVTDAAGVAAVRFQTYRVAECTVASW